MLRQFVEIGTWAFLFKFLCVTLFILIATNLLMGWITGGVISLVALAMISAVFFAFPSQAFAQTQESQTSTGFTVATGDEIKKNPAAMKILERIEESKRILAEMQNQQKTKSDHEKFVDEQRRVAKESLGRDLESFNKKYVDFTPHNAFAKFVSRVNATHAAFFWDQFNHLDNKIAIATQAKNAVLEGGGTYAEARAEYIKYAAMSRTEMIKLVSELNIKYQFTDTSMEAYFDSNGKLPRYDDDGIRVCYGCAKYEKIKEEMLAREAAVQNS